MLPQDPMILLSTINTRLRDDYDSLDALCDDLELNREELEARLLRIDCRYDPELNRFR